VWAMASLLVQVTVVPFLTVILAGLKAMSLMVTISVAVGAELELLLCELVEWLFMFMLLVEFVLAVELFE